MKGLIFGKVTFSIYRRTEKFISNGSINSQEFRKKEILIKIQKIVDEAYSNLINQDIDTFGKL